MCRRSTFSRCWEIRMLIEEIYEDPSANGGDENTNT